MEKNKNTKEVAKKSSEKPLVKAENSDNFSSEIEKFDTKISDLSERIKKIEDLQNEIVKNNTSNYSEIKSSLD